MTGVNGTASLSGRVALVTGAADGLGFATAAELGRAAATVLVHGRTQLKAERAVQRLAEMPHSQAGRYIPVYAELSSGSELRDLASNVRELTPDGLHVLINNAGAQFSERRLTVDGLEMTTAVVHVAAAALSRLLIGHLRKGAATAGAPSQVINVTSINERFGRPVTDWSYATGYGQVRAYSNAKLMALAYTYGLARRIDENEVTVSAADPGAVFTDFGRKAGGSAGRMDRLLRPVAPLLIASPERAARRSVMLAMAPGNVRRTGAFYARGARRTSSRRSREKPVIDRVYALTEERLAELGF
ncbi:NAD(P)-dependent dehydrogenase (short-subunit alcohol dehydrogenase family) [Actinoplanes tereljensis]|uniref:Short-chain dehydrogenase n=1 Tax=Paractinoplanes tereljensis TaxID=571912 RepID=A0A919U0B1_9ACTN|nr:SDR family NAD(P)-dependent oxidoreductase [Actinoplanes tereljensis]GIF26707.1 short-chain dehydrogenase [Actinoplanes tereljensis]